MIAINQLKIKTRIILLILTPLVVTLFFAFHKFQAAKLDMDEVGQFNILHEYVTKATPVISAIQKEHMYTKMYLGPAPTKPDLEFERRMQQSRRPVDNALAEFNAYIQDLQKFAEFPSLQQNINHIKSTIKALPLARQNADKRIRSFTNPAKPGTKLYTINVIRTLGFDLIASTHEVVLLASGHRELSRLANAFENILHAKHYGLTLNGVLYTAVKDPLKVKNLAIITKLILIEETFQDLFSGFAPPDIIKSFKQDLVNIRAYQATQPLYKSIVRKGDKMIGTPLPVDKDEWLNRGQAINQAYEKIMAQLLSQMSESKEALLNNAKTEVMHTLIVIVILLFIVLTVSSLIVSSINKPLSKLIRLLGQLESSKDMSLRSDVQGKNELTLVGKAFNSLISSFEKTLSRVRSKIVSMDSTTQSVASAMENSMQLIDHQREATDSISGAINEMTATIYQVSEMSASTSQIVKRTYNLSKESEEDAQRSKTTMDELFAELRDTSKLIEKLNDEASQISSILQVIKGISEQTNLLALNAAIEAARAGEKGRGFAVVADEVRELSKRTQNSTEQIQEQIETLTSGAAATSKKMEMLQNNGAQAAEIVQKSTNAFITIKSELDKITNMAAQIAVAAEQQTQVADEINQRIHVIKGDSESMYEQGNQMLSSTQTLLISGRELKADIETFRFK